MHLSENSAVFVYHYRFYVFGESPCHSMLDNCKRRLHSVTMQHVQRCGNWVRVHIEIHEINTGPSVAVNGTVWLHIVCTV